MAYHFGRERRHGTDRRVSRYPAYAGDERRTTDRRRPRPDRTGPFGWIVIALILIVMLDTTVWQGYYRHAIYRGLDAQAASVRAWSDGLWDWGSTR